MFAKPVAALLITAWYQNSEALVQCVIPANKYVGNKNYVNLAADFSNGKTIELLWK